MKPSEPLLPPVLVPPELLQSNTLQEILEAFVLREGTDYGAVEKTLEEKVSHVRRQLDRGDVVIVFDPNTESVNLLTQKEWAPFANPSDKQDL